MPLESVFSPADVFVMDLVALYTKIRISDVILLRHLSTFQCIKV